MTRRAVLAAGGVLWRGDADAPEVALVHRPAYDDWSIPKGKAKPGEHILLTALREVAEETGHRPRIGPRLTTVRYPASSGGRRAVKIVSYWSMRAAGGSFVPNREVDVVAWLAVDAARRTLTSDSDRGVLDAFVQRPRDTEPLMLVRHGARGADSGRSVGHGGQHLNRSGRLRAAALAPVLEEVGVSGLLSADVPSCVDTLRPLAAATGLTVRRDDRLTRGAFAGNECDIADRLRQDTSSIDGLVVCGQRPVLAGLLRALSTDGTAPVPSDSLRKGGWWLLHHRDGRVMACEQFKPVA